MKHLWELIGVFKITKKKVRDVVTIIVVNNKYGIGTYLLKDE